MNDLNVIKKDVSQNEEQKEPEYIWIYSDMATYKIKNEKEYTIYQDKYKALLDILKKAEKRLKEKIGTIPINYSVITTLESYFKIDELNELLDIMGKWIFEFIIDISLADNLFITNPYLTKEKLIDLMRFYAKCNSVFWKNFLNFCPSIFLFDFLYLDFWENKVSDSIESKYKSFFRRMNILIPNNLIEEKLTPKSKLACVIYTEYMTKIIPLLETKAKLLEIKEKAKTEAEKLEAEIKIQEIETDIEVLNICADDIGDDIDLLTNDDIFNLPSPSLFIRGPQMFSIINRYVLDNYERLHAYRKLTLNQYRG